MKKSYNFFPRALAPSGVSITAGDICAAIGAILAKTRHLERFREEICCYFNVKHAFFASSGRASLAQLLKAMAKLRPGKDEVLLPAYTSFSVPSAVVKAGLKVALYDVDPATLGPDIKSLKKNLSSSTLGVVVCHLYGYPCDMDTAKEALKGSGAYLIDDAAQTMGARYKGAFVGTLGDAGLFSFSRGKNITTVDGGVIVTDHDDLAKAISEVNLQPINQLRQWLFIIKASIFSLLLKPCLYWIPQKLPFLKLGISEFDIDFPMQRFLGCQAAIGRRMLKRLEKINRGRWEKARSIAGKLQNIEKMIVQPVEGAEPVFLRFPVITTCESQSPKPCLGIVKSYPTPLNEITELKQHLVDDGEFHVAKNLTTTLITLPTHAFVTEGDIDGIVKSVGSGMKSNKRKQSY